MIKLLLLVKRWSIRWSYENKIVISEEILIQILLNHYDQEIHMKTSHKPQNILNLIEQENWFSLLCKAKSSGLMYCLFKFFLCNKFTQNLHDWFLRHLGLEQGLQRTCHRCKTKDRFLQNLLNNLPTQRCTIALIYVNSLKCYGFFRNNMFLPMKSTPGRGYSFV